MKRPFLLLVLLALLLVACQGATPTTEAAPQTATVPASATPPATSTTVPGDASLASSDSPGCVVQSPFPTPGPTEQSLFPPVNDKDWTQGPESAMVTFTEYSDFQ